ncbi:MAG: Gx transporter family protein [Clostridia bacterium]|nr:Gx transporter family protein [Clostridia bacterium]
MFIKRFKAKEIAAVGLLVSLGLVLHYAESILPFFQVLPGGRLGLANIVTLLAFSLSGTGTALLVGLLRCFLSGVFGGAVSSIIYSGFGTLFSVLAMWLAKRLLSQKVSTIGRSMLGAFFFNAAQVSVCAILLENTYVFSYLPPLTIVSAFCGLLTGICAKRVEKSFCPQMDGEA